MADKLLPHNIDAEESLLGAILVDGKAIREVFNYIQTKDFYSERNSWIYEACAELYKRLEAINQVTVSEELSRKDRLVNCGGAAYLNHCINSCPTSLDIKYYADIVYRLSISRMVIAKGDQLSAIGYESNPDINEIVSKSEKILSDIKRINTTDSKVITPDQAGNDILQMIENYSKPANYPAWGYRALDDITGGIAPEYHIIGARPQTGKTQLMLDIYRNTTRAKRTGLFVSAEMTKEQIYERLASESARLNILDLRKYGMTDEQGVQLCTLAAEVSESTTHLLCGKISLNDIYREVYKLMERGKLELVFIDYIGALIDAYAENRDTQATRISRMSNKIQGMVHEFGIPFIVASQLNREIEHRDNGQIKGLIKSKIPRLSDLRDSGSLEQDADVIFLLHRDLQDDNTLSPILKLWMGKNRQLGPSRVTKLLFNYNLHRYVDYTEREENE